MDMNNFKTLTKRLSCALCLLCGLAAALTGCKENISADDRRG